MRITTKAVWDNMSDFCAGTNPDRWEGYEYHGPVALCGALIAKLGSNLTNPIVAVPGQPAQSFPNDALAGKDLASLSAQTMQPGRSTVDGTIGDPTTVAQPPLLNAGETVGQPDQTTTSFTPAPVSPQPTITHPSWDINHPEQMTRKGQILDYILQGGIGAGNALAAQSEALTRNPRVNPGIGPAIAAGLATPGMLRQQGFEQQAEAARLTQLGQEGQIRQAQVDAIPGQRSLSAAQLADVQSQTNERNAKATMYNNKPDPAVKSIDELIAGAAASDPNPATNSKLAQLMDVKTGMQKQAENDPEFRAWQQQNPNGSIGDYFKVRYPKQQINVGTGDPNDINTLAQGMVDGTLGGTILSRLPGNVKLAAISAAKKLDPNFDMTNFANRQKVANDFGSGKSADQIQSFNTFLAHAADLSSAVNDFRATKSPLINKPYIWLRKNSGDPAVASYLAKTEPVRMEFETFLNNKHALTESDMQSAKQVLDNNASPAQMQATIKSMTHTAGLRLREVNQRYRNTMHTDYAGLVDPQNAQFLQDSGAMGALGNGGKSSNANAAQTGSSVPTYDVNGNRVK
jgi:hypothetical protein